ncbi:unnamed protein product [Polarella glacialis]|uniref:Uncharacterized protein n=1 Tax=Polarella glacialis TaxID=89957 RepID=A0A813EMA9_POLGL|nr:unnamed protein product [Polarella glacialis]
MVLCRPSWLQTSSPTDGSVEMAFQAAAAAAAKTSAAERTRTLSVRRQRWRTRTLQVVAASTPAAAEARTDSKQHVGGVADVFSGGGEGEDPSSSCSKDFKFQAEAEKASTPSTEHHGQAAKAVRILDMENVARFLVEGVVQVLQIRQKQGKAPLPVDQVASEFRACWTTPFILAQAGETDTVTFLRKWPTKIDVVQEQGEYVVQLAKQAGEKSKVPAMVPQCAPAPPTIRKEAARAQAREA